MWRLARGCCGERMFCTRYLAMDLIKKNNIEVIKGADRTSTTTIAALHTAVTVAQALASHNLVLDQITALQTTTSNMIKKTSELLKTNTAYNFAIGGVNRSKI